MDFGSIRDQVSNLTLYDIKAGVRKVQNAVMNYTEMEAKVREATNNEPWGASSTLMQEIANGTYSYQLLNEIMPMIYKRFTEKSAEEWRQIYKSLQLLEFLIKNGSERVIDDARSHLSLLKMLRQFQFYDQNGKDQGINVRNRAKELAELLSDVDRIRAERKKARSNRNKFGGVEGGSSSFGGMSGGIGSSSRYGGFGSEDANFGGYTGGVYGDGGGFGGNASSFNDSGRRDKFEEYDEGDDVENPPSSSRHTATASTSSSVRRKVEELKPKEPEVDLFEFGDDEPAQMTAPPSATKASITGGDEDDFDDFISATPAPSTTTAATSLSGMAPPPATTTSVSASTHFAAPKPVSAVQKPNISGLASISSMSPTPSQQPIAPMPSLVSTPGSAFTSPPPLAQPSQPPLQSQPSYSSPTSTTALAPQLPRPTGYQAAQPNYYTSVQAQATASGSSTGGIAGPKPGLTSTPSFGAANKSSSAASGGKGGSGGDVFGNLWSSASAGSGIKKTAPTQGLNLASLAKEKTSAGIWGPSAAQQKPVGGQQGLGMGMGMAAQQRPQGQVQQPAAQQQQQQGGGVGGGLDDLLG